MTAQAPWQALADTWDAQALKCDEAAALPGLAKAAVLEQATFAAQLRDCARQLRDLGAVQGPQPAPGAAHRLAIALYGLADELDPDDDPAPQWGARRIAMKIRALVRQAMTLPLPPRS